jgi:Na+-transporting methylmalonyl-CoA/oxaloacetate decarboxylase gamma subunit
MDFSFIKIDLSSLNNGDLDVIQFSIIGMCVVFGGLTLIAAYIALLPKMLALFDKMRIKAHAPKAVSDDEIDNETLLAIATAVHLHMFSSDDNRKITWERHEIWDSSWQRAGRFEAMNRHGQ